MYIIKVVLFRKSDLYYNSFVYKGIVQTNITVDNKNTSEQLFIIDVNYIGGEPNSSYESPHAVNYQYDNKYILNTNFRDYNSEVLVHNPFDALAIIKDEKESFKLKNQSACFNLDMSIYQPNIDVTDFNTKYILPYLTQEYCESKYDWYGRKKNYGIFDKPCTKNEDCPFYKHNKNYNNSFGGCLSDGKCELPTNMKNLGYHFNVPLDIYKPLCYNCNETTLLPLTKLDMCCDEQYDKSKYPFLNGPDYAFDSDSIQRQNEIKL